MTPYVYALLALGGALIGINTWIKWVDDRATAWAEMTDQ